MATASENGTVERPTFDGKWLKAKAPHEATLWVTRGRQPVFPPPGETPAFGPKEVIVEVNGDMVSWPKVQFDVSGRKENEVTYESLVIAVEGRVIATATTDYPKEHMLPASTVNLPASEMELKEEYRV